MNSEKYNNLVFTAKCNTLLVLADDFKNGGGRADLLSMYVFLKENRFDRNIFIKLLNQLPDNIIVYICKFCVELGDAEFQSFIAHHKLLADYQAESSDYESHWHL